MSEKYVSRKFSVVTSAIISVVVLIYGIILILWPSQAFQIGSIVVGIGVVLSAIRSLIIFREVHSVGSSEPNIVNSLLAKSIIMLIAGILMIVFPWISYETYHFLWFFIIYVASIILVACGVLSVAQAIFFARDNDSKSWNLILIFEGILCVVAGIALMPNVVSRFLGDAALRVLGVALIVFSICFFISNYQKRYDLEEI